MEEYLQNEHIPIWHDYVKPIGANLETRKTDRGGYTYHEIYFNKKCDSTITLDNKVRAFSGQPKIVLREGPSVFGPQIILQNCLTHKIGSKPYDASTLKCYPTQEIYLPADQRTITFLEAVIRIFKKEMERMGCYGGSTD